MTMFTKLPNWASILITVIAAIIVVGLVSWGTYTLVKPGPSKLPEGDEVTTPEQQPEENQPAVEEQFKNWKTYRNEEWISRKHTFEVKYPEDWEMKEWISGNQCVQFNPSGLNTWDEEYAEIAICVKEYKYIGEIENGIKKWFEPTSLEISSTEIDSIPVQKITGKLISYYQDIPLRMAIILKKGDRVYPFYLRCTGEEIDEKVNIFNQILSTFKFLK